MYGNSGKNLKGITRNFFSKRCLVWAAFLRSLFVVGGKVLPRDCVASKELCGVEHFLASFVGGCRSCVGYKWLV